MFYARQRLRDRLALIGAPRDALEQEGPR
jgi:hypothetical protein